MAKFPIRFLGLVLLVIALGVSNCSALYHSADRSASETPAVSGTSG